MKFSRPKGLPRWALTLLTGLLLILVAGTIWFYRTQKQESRQAAVDRLTFIGQMKTAQICDWRAERLADAATLMEDPFLRAGIVRFLADPLPENTTPLLARLRSLQAQYHYDDVLLVDLEGHVLLSLSQSTLTCPQFTQALSVAVERRTSVMTELHTEVSCGVLHIGVIAPVLSGDDPDARLLCAFILVNDASRFLYPLIQSWPIPGKTAESLLVRREGDDVLFLNNLRFLPDAALKLRISLSSTNVPAVQAVRGKEGLFEGTDYRGTPVVSFILKVPDTPWFMVVKQDSTEVFAAWYFRSRIILVHFLSMLVIFVIIGLFIRQRSKNAHLRTLYLTEARLHAESMQHSITLKSIGDGVISTDAQRRVVLLNPVAEALTGWTEAEAKGQMIESVFQIINEKTRQKVESPVEKVLRDGAIAGLANHTLLLARNGTERPIADSAAPIMNSQGLTTGVVLVFRDQTVEQNYRMLFDQMLDGFALHEIICDASGQPVDYRFLNLNPAFECMTGLKAKDIIGKTVMDVLPGIEHQWIETYGRVALTGESTRFENYSNELKRHFSVSVFCPARNQFATIIQDITEHRKMEERIRQTHKMESVGLLAGGVAHDFNNMLGVILGNAELILDDLDPDSPVYGRIQEIIRAGKRSADITRQLLAFARKQTIAPKVLDLNDTVEGMLTMLRRLIGENIDLFWSPATVRLPVRMDPSQLDQILVNLCVNARDAIGGVGKITIDADEKTLDEEYCKNNPDAHPGHFVLLDVGDDGCGMDREIQGRLFEPFFSTKEVGKGTGLGLATVYGIIRQNNGFINVYSEPGVGTVFKIYLPYHAGAIAEVEPTAPDRFPLSNGETILLVEDEKAILKIIMAMLTKLGYQVLAADTPEVALQVAASHAGPIDLLVTDVIMPMMNGRELAERIKASHSVINVLFMSGYTADVIAHHGVLDSGVNFLQKPFSLPELAKKIQQILTGDMTDRDPIQPGRTG